MSCGVFAFLIAVAVAVAVCHVCSLLLLLFSISSSTLNQVKVYVFTELDAFVRRLFMEAGRARTYGKELEVSLV